MEKDFDKEFDELVSGLKLTDENIQPEALFLTDLSNLAATMNAICAVMNKFVADALLEEEGNLKISQATTIYMAHMSEVMDHLLELVVKDMAPTCTCEECASDNEDTTETE